MKMSVRSLSSSAVKLICSVLSLSFQFARIGSASFRSLPWSRVYEEAPPYAVYLDPSA